MSDPSVRGRNRLEYIWVWLPLSIAGGMLVVPFVDIFTLLFTHLFAFFCFFCAVFAASAVAHPRRWWLALICTFAAAGMAYIIWAPLPVFRPVHTAIFALVNAGFGFAVYTSLAYRRKEILVALFISCLLGVSYWPFGFLMAIPAVLYFDRWQDRLSGNRIAGTVARPGPHTN